MARAGAVRATPIGAAAPCVLSACEMTNDAAPAPHSLPLGGQQRRVGGERAIRRGVIIGARRDPARHQRQRLAVALQRLGLVVEPLQQRAEVAVGFGLRVDAEAGLEIATAFAPQLTAYAQAPKRLQLHGGGGVKLEPAFGGNIPTRLA